MIYYNFFAFFRKNFGKNVFNKPVLNQFCVFDVFPAIQDGVLPSSWHQINFRAGW